MQSIETIKEKANYCLNCRHKPCQNACPMQTNIPLFIEKIRENDIEKAYKILMDNNIFSSICSSICPRENQCEGSCTRGIKNKPVNIGELEHWVNEYAKHNSFEYNVNIKEKNKHTVAIIGSGPASLSCAYELAKEGIDVTIFEKENELGGILRYGIPPYRVNKNDLDVIINKILELGIKVKTNCEFGKEITLKELKDNGFEYIFIVIRAKGNQEKLSEIECIKTQVIDGKAVDIENTNYNKDVDTLIFAIGLSPEKQLLEKKGITLKNGLVIIDENGKTNLDNVYAGGDVTENKSTVCRAIAGGRKAAKGILLNFKK